jgi:hypothetical protein
MGNTQKKPSDASRLYIELDHPGVIYLPNDIISGNVLHVKDIQAYVQLIGVICFNKRKKKRLETRKILFFSTKFDLISSPTKQNFQLRLNEYLPPSFNNASIYPHISYSINLIYKKSDDQIQSSIPIHVCPFIKIDQPSLLIPLFFGPIENKNYHTKFEVKINRSAFKFNDTVQIFYELQNLSEEFIYKINVSLGMYCLVESSVWHQDICDGTEICSKIIPSKCKLIRNKVLLNIPNKIYLPPTIQYKYGQEGDESKFNLSIDYKIQFKIYLGNPDNLWQMDVPIVLCNDLLEHKDLTITDLPRICDKNCYMSE